MIRRFHAGLLLCLLGLLAACSPGEFQAPNGVDPNTVPDTHELRTWAYRCDDGAYVDQIGTGMGDRYGNAMQNPASLTISNPQTVTQILAQVVVKHSRNYATPDEVVFTAHDSGGAVVETHVAATPVVTTPLGLFYEYIFDVNANQISEISAEVVGDQSQARWYNARALTAYVFRSGDSMVSEGGLLDHDLYGDDGRVSATETIILPTGAPRDVTVDLSIVDLSSDEVDAVEGERLVKVRYEAGGMVWEDTYTDGQYYELLLISKDLSLPEGSTEIKITVISPEDTGDSIFWGGLNVTYACAKGRFTGGGHVTAAGVKYTFGLTLHCDIELSNNLEINWTTGKGKDALTNQWHLEKESLTDVLCADHTDIIQPPPVAPLDTLTAEAVGRLTFGRSYKQEDGSVIRVKIVDGGEPGRKDYISVSIWAPGADPDSAAPLVTFAGYLGGGNLQAHYDQPHGNKP